MFNFGFQSTFMSNLDQQQALQQLKDIKQMMSRSSKFLSLSGLAGVFAGIYAIIGAIAAYQILNWGKVRFSDYGSIIHQPTDDYVWWLLLVGLSVLLLSIITAWYFTKQKAKRLGTRMWDENAKRLFLNFIIPLVAGGLLTLILVFKYHLLFLIAPLTLLFYGLSLWSASKFSFDELKYLGLIEIGLGILATLFIGYGLLFWTIGFGVLHIIYGVIMYKKHS